MASPTSSAPVASVSLWIASARFERDDEGEPVVILTDGDTEVELSRGLGGDPASAARGAQRLAKALLEYASAVERSGGS